MIEYRVIVQQEITELTIVCGMVDTKDTTASEKKAGGILMRALEEASSGMFGGDWKMRVQTGVTPEQTKEIIRKQIEGDKP